MNNVSDCGSGYDSTVRFRAQHQRRKDWRDSSADYRIRFYHHCYASIRNDGSFIQAFKTGWIEGHRWIFDANVDKLIKSVVQYGE